MKCLLSALSIRTNFSGSVEIVTISWLSGGRDHSGLKVHLIIDGDHLLPLHTQFQFPFRTLFQREQITPEQFRTCTDVKHGSPSSRGYASFERPRFHHEVKQEIRSVVHRFLESPRNRYNPTASALRVSRLMVPLARALGCTVGSHAMHLRVPKFQSTTHTRGHAV
ncbi:hypothetical protein EJ02DRAFT_241217 [Clathrospora elynae]|uniref:Uncharacterized protein n=1 Tax=Clathrospora elynae TaxID=706981 RepID=A0A6A5SSG6_9PLEO|nr:hypothetical protein EJ02DRAFT_241217 [Clathrospora elynae]